jgi:hypothetical protein
MSSTSLARPGKRGLYGRRIRHSAVTALWNGLLGLPPDIWRHGDNRAIDAALAAHCLPKGDVRASVAFPKLPLS